MNISCGKKDYLKLSREIVTEFERMQKYVLLLDSSEDKCNK